MATFKSQNIEIKLNSLMGDQKWESELVKRHCSFSQVTVCKAILLVVLLCTRQQLLKALLVLQFSSMIMNACMEHLSL